MFAYCHMLLLEFIYVNGQQEKNIISICAFCSVVLVTQHSVLPLMSLLSYIDNGFIITYAYVFRCGKTSALFGYVRL